MLLLFHFSLFSFFTALPFFLHFESESYESRIGPSLLTRVIIFIIIMARVFLSQIPSVSPHFCTFLIQKEEENGPGGAAFWSCNSHLSIRRLGPIFLYFPFCSATFSSSQHGRVFWSEFWSFGRTFCQIFLFRNTQIYDNLNVFCRR